MAVELPKDMRLRLMKYRGVRGVVLYRDLETGKLRVLPKAFFLALKELKPKRYELVAEAPTFRDLLELKGHDLERILMDEVNSPEEEREELIRRAEKLLKQIRETIEEARG